MEIAEQKGHGHFPRGARFGEEPQARFLGKAICFSRIHVLGGEHAVVPGGGTTARARDDVVDVPLFGSQRSSRVLAATTIAFADGASTELGTFERHPVEVGQHDHRGHAHAAMHRSNEGIRVAHGQVLPVLPRSGNHRVRALDVQGGGHIRRHLGERHGWAGRVDGLPVPVENEDDMLVQAAHVMMVVEGNGDVRRMNASPRRFFAGWCSFFKGCQSQVRACFESWDGGWNPLPTSLRILAANPWKGICVL